MSVYELHSQRMLMEVLDIYEPDTVIFESAIPGTDEVELLSDCVCEVICVAGGAGGASSKHSSGMTSYKNFLVSGASGSAFVGTVKLPKGKIIITRGVGGNSSAGFGYANGGTGGESSIGELIVAHPGIGGGCRAEDQYSYASKGGEIPTIRVAVIEEVVNSAGNDGKTSYFKNSTQTILGGDSLYGNYGTGGSASGGKNSASAGPGTPGYVKIVYKSLRG